MKDIRTRVMAFLVLTLLLLSVQDRCAFSGLTERISGGQQMTSECFSWNDVIDKYNVYLNAQANWTEVIRCYTEYVTLNDAFVTTTDYQTGHFATINIEDQSVKKYELNLSSDAVVKTINHKIYVVNRSGQDNITIFSPAEFSDPIIQFSTGNGSNPQDIVLSSSEKAYVSLFEQKYILVVNPNNGVEIKQIDISQFADSDGIPEAWKMVIVDNILYVVLQNLDRKTYQPAGNGVLLMINTSNDSIVGSITLSGKNPYDMLYNSVSHELVISQTGSFNDLTDGGIETVNLDTHLPSGFILTESDLEGNITFFVMKPFSSKGYIIVTDGSYNTSVVSFDLEQAVKLKDVLIGDGFIYSGIASGDEKLLVGDRSLSNPGVRIVSTLTDEEITTKPLDTGLPPLSITIY